MKGWLCIVSCLLIMHTASGQFYYQDIYSTQQANNDHSLLKKNKVKRLIIRSMDANLEINNNFLCEKTYDHDYREETATTKSSQTGNSVLISIFNDHNQIIQSTDSSGTSATTTQYIYNSSGNLLEISFNSNSGDMIDQSGFSEDHIYQYDSSGSLSKMIRKKNGGDYSIVEFTTDSTGQVIEEQEIVRQSQNPAIFYKYQGPGKLTDIFRYNKDKAKMLADQMFDYDNQGQLAQMTTVLSDTDDYNTWKYYYDKKGLILKEECYEKGQDLLGIMQYSYNYR